MKKICVLIIAACIVMGAASTSHALILTSGPSESGLGKFIASFNYSYVDSTSGEIVVKIKNVSPIGNSGFITAFAFNNPGNLITGVTLNSTDSDFAIIGAPFTTNGIAAGPFGNFDIGASISSTFQGGGNASPGLGIGQAAVFKFSLSGTGLDTLMAESFFSASALSAPPADGQGAQNFIVRYRGFGDGGSDKVVGVPHGAVPEPASMLLFGSGLAGAFLRRRFQA